MTAFLRRVVTFYAVLLGIDDALDNARRFTHPQPSAPSEGRVRIRR